MSEGEAERDYERALRAELDRRVSELASYPDDAFGELGRKDVLLVGLLCLFVPALLLWWCR